VPFLTPIRAINSYKWKECPSPTILTSCKTSRTTLQPPRVSSTQGLAPWTDSQRLFALQLTKAQA
jgi:hypothetical protein